MQACSNKIEQLSEVVVNREGVQLSVIINSLNFHSVAMLARFSACVEESTPFSKRLILMAY